MNWQKKLWLKTTDPKLHKNKTLVSLSCDMESIYSGITQNSMLHPNKQNKKQQQQNSPKLCTHKSLKATDDWLTADILYQVETQFIK